MEKNLKAEQTDKKDRNRTEKEENTGQFTAVALRILKDRTLSDMLAASVYPFLKMGPLIKSLTTRAKLTGKTKDGETL